MYLPELLEPGGDAVASHCGGVSIQDGAVVVQAHGEKPAAGRDAVATAGWVGGRLATRLISLQQYICVTASGNLGVGGRRGGGRGSP